MLFNLIDFLRGVSLSLDYIEKIIFGFPTNHSKRVAYISLRISQALNLQRDQVFDLLSLAILHDIGASLKTLHENLVGSQNEKRSVLEASINHCIVGEEIIQDFPFLTNPQNVIKYHHENEDGSGFFGIIGNQIPLMAQIIHLADSIERNFIINIYPENKYVKNSMQNFLKINENKMFSEHLIKVFIPILDDDSFWVGISDLHIDSEIRNEIKDYNQEYDFDTIRRISKTFSRIIDSKSSFTLIHSSSVAAITEKMADRYKMNRLEKNKILIAADLHDLGKLGVSNDILDKPGGLTDDEFTKIKEHPLIGFECLKEIIGFEDISKWVLNHHEKINGTGYPNGKKGNELDFNSRLISCVDIFVALQEDRPYRPGFTRENALKILFDMANKHLIDLNICQEISSLPSI